MLNLKPNVSKLRKMRYMTLRVCFQKGSKFMEYTYCFIRAYIFVGMRLDTTFSGKIIV